MVQPKYNPEEALQRIKLMMEYDSSKTLNENKKTIFEQVGPNEAAEIAQDIRTELFGDVQSVDLEDIREILKTRVFGKTYEDGGCLLDKVMSYFSKARRRWSDLFTTTTLISGMIRLSGSNELIATINSSRERDEPQFEDIKKKLLDAINSESNGFCKNPKPPKPPKPVNPVNPVNPPKPSRYRNCDKEPRYTKGCRTRPEGPIGQVQACLGGLVQDGKFWEKTQAALEDAGYPNGFTIEEIKTICGNQTKPEEVKPLPPDDEVSDVNNA
jgi:hypothetical protein